METHSGRDLRADLRWGLKWAIAMAVGFSLIGFLRLLVLESGPDQISLTLGVAVPIYLAAAIIGGIILGLLRPISSSRPGRALVGAVIGATLFAVLTPFFASVADPGIPIPSHMWILMPSGGAVYGAVLSQVL